MRDFRILPVLMKMSGQEKIVGLGGGQNREKDGVFFFFQAEDGIRDLYVIGVQTCALPIWRRGPGTGCRGGPSHRGWRTGPSAGPRGPPSGRGRSRRTDSAAAQARRAASRTPGPAAAGRSEERRVGKECGGRWGPW